MNGTSHKKANPVCFHLYEAPRVVTFRDRGRMVLARGWGMGVGCGVWWVQSSSLQDEKHSDARWWGWFHNNVNALKSTELYLSRVEQLSTLN